MTNYEILSLVTAFIALLVSIIVVYFNGVQTKKAIQAIIIQQQIARGNTVEHFTGRFFDLLNNGDLIKQIEDRKWAYQFWSLLSTEFYFFHHGILPPFMYSLWMIDLSKVYCMNDKNTVRESHVEYLNTYSFQYPEMTTFFNKIYTISRNDCDHELDRNKKIADYVTNWIKDNKKDILQ